MYPRLEKPSNSSQNNFGKITKNELYEIKKHRITKFFCVIFFPFEALFPAFLKCYKMWKT